MKRERERERETYKNEYIRKLCTFALAFFKIIRRLQNHLKGVCLNTQLNYLCQRKHQETEIAKNYQPILRENVAKRTGLTNPDLIVDDWTKLASMEKLADCAFITTQDRMHLAPAIAFASKGYHLLLEKPMSVDEEECKQESYLYTK